ncbi:MAG: P-loop NTPase [Pseudomonadota bacterium]
MKILICGKGGSGKSTTAAMMALAFHDMGRQVLVVDADDSNQCLHRLLGCPRPMSIMDDLGGKPGFRDRVSSAGATVFHAPTEPVDLPASVVPQRPNLSLVSVGKIHHFGEGCACPMGRLFGMLFDRLHTPPGTVVLVDTAAGVEHFGRRLDGAVDRLVAIIDPSGESLEMAGRFAALAAEAGKPLSFILNRVDPDVAGIMADHVPAGQLLAKIPVDREVMMDNLLGNPLTHALPEVAEACRCLLDELPAAKMGGRPSPFRTL